MKNPRHILPVIFFSIVLFTTCNSQQNNQHNSQTEKLINRQPAVSGRFYAANKLELKNNLELLFKEAIQTMGLNVQAVISPHAGYVFSGGVAASAYNQIDFSKAYDNIFLIGSSHTAFFEGASVYSIGNYITPLGEVNVNIKLAKKLISENENFSFVEKVHQTEHSIEVQLPFLQYKMQYPFEIVPIIIGTQSKKVCKEIANTLKPFFNENNLFVISSDFSHYPGYDDAKKWDQLTANTIISNIPYEFINSVETKNDDDIPNLATRCCGWSSVYTLMNLTKDTDDYKYHHIQYKNSGDSEYGDKSKVVGYHAIVVDGKIDDIDFQLSPGDKKILLNIARKTIENYIVSGNTPGVEKSQLTNNLLAECGSFVSLYKNGVLRGCIGRFSVEEPLYKVVQQMSIASATKDSRFPQVSTDELKDINIEISVLTPLKKIKSVDEIELGKHGIYIIKGQRTGTFLPQVAKDTGWNIEEFLGHCSRDKAGIGWDGWKTAELFIYEAVVFSEGAME